MPLASRNTVSFVLVCPSTEMLLKALFRGGFENALKIGRGDRRVRQNETEHGRHVRADHGGALGEAR